MCLSSVGSDSHGSADQADGFLLHLAQGPGRSRPSASSGSIARSGCERPESPALEGVFAPLCLAARQVHGHHRFPSGFRNVQDVAGQGGCGARPGPEDQAAFSHLLRILETMSGDAYRAVRDGAEPQGGGPLTPAQQGRAREGGVPRNGLPSPFQYKFGPMVGSLGTHQQVSHVDLCFAPCLVLAFSACAHQVKSFSG